MQRQQSCVGKWEARKWKCTPAPEQPRWGYLVLTFHYMDGKQAFSLTKANKQAPPPQILMSQIILVTYKNTQLQPSYNGHKIHLLLASHLLTTLHRRWKSASQSFVVWHNAISSLLHFTVPASSVSPMTYLSHVLAYWNKCISLQPQPQTPPHSAQVQQ